MKSIREAGEELEGNNIGDDESEEKREDRRAPEGRGLSAAGDLCDTTIEEATREKLRSKGNKQREDNEADAEEAELKEEGEGLVLDDFLRAGDAGDRRIEVESGASATETDAEENIRGKPGIKGGRIERETNIGRFSNVAVEIWRL